MVPNILNLNFSTLCVADEEARTRTGHKLWTCMCIFYCIDYYHPAWRCSSSISFRYIKWIEYVRCVSVIWTGRAGADCGECLTLSYVVAGGGWTAIEVSECDLVTVRRRCWRSMYLWLCSSSDVHRIPFVIILGWSTEIPQNPTFQWHGQGLGISMTVCSDWKRGLNMDTL